MKNYGTKIGDTKTSNPKFAELKTTMRANQSKVGQVFKSGKSGGCGCHK